MEPELTQQEQEMLNKSMSEPSTLKTWGVSSAKTGETAALILMIVACAGTLLGTGAYLVGGDPVAVNNGLTGFFIVLALAIATVVLRIFQRKLQHQDAQNIKNQLDSRLTGIADKDMAIQVDIEDKMEWSARKLNMAGFMIAIAMVAISILNINQGGGTDMERSMIFSGALAMFAFGYIWHMMSFNHEILATELRSRVIAAIVYQRTNQNAEAIADLQAAAEDEEL